MKMITFKTEMQMKIVKSRLYHVQPIRIPKKLRPKLTVYESSLPTNAKCILSGHLCDCTARSQPRVVKDCASPADSRGALLGAPSSW